MKYLYMFFVPFIIFNSIKASDFDPPSENKYLTNYYFIRDLNPQDFIAIESQPDSIHINFASHEQEVQHQIIEDLKSLGMVDKYCGQEEKIFKAKDYKSWEYNINLALFNTMGKLDILREILPKDFYSESQWDAITVVAERVFALKVKQNEGYAACYVPPEISLDYYLIRSIWSEGDDTLAKMKSHLAEGDSIIGVGNTPQYLLKWFQMGYKDSPCPHEIISLAISGHPGRAKYPFDWLKDLLTPEGLDHYRGYLKKTKLLYPCNYFQNCLVFRYC